MQLPICWQQHCLNIFVTFLRHIHSQNMHDLDLDLQNGPRSIVYMPMERLYATFLFLTIAMFALYVTICQIFAVKVCMTLTLTSRMGQSQMQICPSKDLNVGNSNICRSCYHLRDSHSQNVYVYDKIHIHEISSGCSKGSEKRTCLGETRCMVTLGGQGRSSEARRLVGNAGQLRQDEKWARVVN